jgi:hypothetical protein
MNNFLIGTFLLLHGLVHGWFVVLAAGLVNFKSNMGWTGESWLLSVLFQPAILRFSAVILYSLSGLLFGAGAVGVYATATWKMQFLIAGAILSSTTIILFFDGNLQMLVQKGLIGLIINVYLIFYILILR